MNPLIVSILGGLFVSDATAVAQIMVSRPIFCGPVIGLVLGDIFTGILVGIVMELLWISVVPLGNAVPPDSTVVAVSATYLAVQGPEEYRYGYILFVLLIIIPAGILFKKMDMIHRDFNSFFSHRLEDQLNEGNIGFIDKATYISVSIFVLKAAVFIFLLIMLGENLCPCLYGMLGSGIKKSLHESFFMIPSVGLGTAISTFIFKKSQTKKDFQ
ncbi:MAG: PTS sugar transporter subunit IIC [Elusimicrobia bacterium]|nr:PTS sugar transporter subunit IIC [Elusimicrobiota bacterium]